ncbi:integumentary mucin C.1 isoform X2 [Magallana gigas]|uniref:integumentary mucin C.1 isoform X2 n=1 Tax=Magallana gigas TaxID=29159 RepID=UPI003341F759
MKLTNIIMFLWIPMFLSILINHSSVQAKPEVVILQGNDGQITSPGYPGNYLNNVNDTWIIKTDDKRANVTFYIQEMDIEKTQGFPCGDYLEITEEDPCCFRLFKRCGTFSGHIKARGREIRVSFISDRTITRKGFSLYWKVSSTSKASATDRGSTIVHSTLRTTTVFKKTVAKNRSVTSRSKLPTTISTTTLGTSTKMTLTPFLDMSTLTLFKAFKMKDKSIPWRMSTKIDSISLFNNKASSTSTKANAKKQMNLIDKDISRSRTYQLQEPQQALTIPVRNTTMASQPSETSKTVIRQPSTPSTAPPSTPSTAPPEKSSKTFKTFTLQSLIPQSTFTKLPSKPPSTVTTQPSKTRAAGHQSTTPYVSRTDASKKTTSATLLSISISGLSISLLALLFCIVIYKRKRKRRKRSRNTTSIHTHEFLSGYELRCYRTMQTGLVQMKDFRECYH